MIAKRPSALRALRNPNFRLYVAGSAISQVGNWFQQTAEIWLILQITGSAEAVGFQTALRFGPLLILGYPSGLLTDKIDRRRLLFITQTAYTIAAATIAIAAFSGRPSLVVIYLVVFARGILNAIDNPLRRTFVRDLVTDAELTNAVSLNSTMHTIARFIGPALAGGVIVAAGVGWCFAFNAVSYGGVLVSLFLIDRRALRPFRPAAGGAAQLLAGLRYAWEERRIRRTLFMVAILGLFPLNYDVVLPLYATLSFGGNATLYGLFVSTMGVGSFLGAIAVVRATRISGASLRWAAGLMTAAFVGLVVAPVVPAALLGLALLGASATAFQIFAQSRLQLAAADTMSGRVLAIYSVALVGTRPLGGIVTGLVVDAAGPQAAFAASAAMVAALLVALVLTRVPRAAPGPAIEIADAEGIVAAGEGR